LSRRRRTDFYRQEAIGIPNLLIAPKENTARDLYEKDIGDNQGRYADGAYFAPDDTTSIGGYEDFEDDIEDPKTTYYDSILSRFEVLREQLQHSPPEEAVTALDGDHPTSLGKLEMAVVRWWKWKMRTSDPLPVQIASMDKGTVLRLLGLMTSGNLLKRGAQVEIGVSRWSWALLARLPERGELTSEEIGVVRELGKKAVAVGKGLQEDMDWDKRIDELEATRDDEEESWDEDHADSHGEKSNELGNHNPRVSKLEAASIGPQLPPELEEEWRNSALPKQTSEEPHGKDDSITLANTAATANTASETPNEGETGDAVTAAKARILSRLHGSDGKDTMPGISAEDSVTRTDIDVTAHARWNTKATVDMIVTIAGEMYGQRDLLQERSIWEDVV